MLKIMGSILVFAAAAGMAGTYKRELADHLALLYALRKLLVDLSCYGNGTRQPVEVLLGCFVRTRSSGRRAARFSGEAKKKITEDSRSF